MLNNIAALMGATPAAVGDYESIQTVTVGGGGSSSISFTSIPSTYSHLQIRLFAFNTQVIDAGQNVWMRFNSDTTSNYARHLLRGNGSVSAAFNATTQTNIRLDAIGSSSIKSGAAVIDILDYTSTTKNKTVRALMGYDQNGSGQIGLNSGLWYKTPEAITNIEINGDGSTFAQYSSFALYGIK
jgi:hypothetical protein